MPQQAYYTFIQPPNTAAAGIVQQQQTVAPQPQIQYVYAQQVPQASVPAVNQQVIYQAQNPAYQCFLQGQVPTQVIEQNQGSNLSFADPAASVEAPPPPSTINTDQPKATKRGKKKTAQNADVEMKEAVSNDGKRPLRGKQMESYNETKLAAKRS